MDMPLDALKPAAAPAAAPDPVTPAAPADAAGGADYVKILADLPLTKQLQEGSPSAVALPPEIFGGEKQFQARLGKIESALPQFDLASVRAPKSKVLVVYNPKIVTPEMINQADEDGSLFELAPSLHDPNAQAPAQGDAQAAPPQPTAPAGAAPGAAAIADARASLLSPKPPTKQRFPASGIVNDLTSRPS